MKMEISLFHLDDIIISQEPFTIRYQNFYQPSIIFSSSYNATCVHNLEKCWFLKHECEHWHKNAAIFCVISNIDIIVALVCIFRHYRWALVTEQINHYMKDRRNLRIRSYYTLVFGKSFFTTIYFLQQVDKNA